MKYIIGDKKQQIIDDIEAILGNKVKLIFRGDRLVSLELPGMSLTNEQQQLLRARTGIDFTPVV